MASCTLEPSSEKVKVSTDLLHTRAILRENKVSNDLLHIRATLRENKFNNDLLHTQATITENLMHLGDGRGQIHNQLSRNLLTKVS